MQPPAHDPYLGTALAGGRYRILRRLGESDFGALYQAEARSNDGAVPVAVKILRPEYAADASLRTRFEREAQILAALSHPHTVRVYDAGQLADGTPFTVMELVVGENLAEVIARGPIAPPRVEHIVAQLCGALGEAHARGIVHRDLKPEVIEVMQQGNRGDFVKVVDFGIAKRDESARDLDSATLTRQGTVLGTPPYMSPEQFTAQKLKGTSDLYALGVLTYEMLTGQLPFAASTPWEWATKHLTAAPTPFEHHPVNARLLPRHRQAVMAALAKRPEDRPPTAQHFLEAFVGAPASEAGSAASAGSAGVRDFLAALGLERYAEVFERHEIEPVDLPHLTDADLVAMGIEAIGPRRRFLTAAAARRGS